MNKLDILNFLSENKSLLRKKYQVSKIGLFGSYAKGTHREDSDIDILVDMPSNFDNFFELKEFLETNLHNKIDLGTFSSIREFIKRNIQDEILYA